MAGSVFDALIQAVDKATGPIRGIAQSVQGLVRSQQAVNREGEKGAASHARFFAALGGHVNVARGNFGALRSSIGEVGSSLTQFLPMLGALGATGSMVGLFAMTEHTATRFAELNRAALKIGSITVPQLQGLETAAAMTDVPVEAMQKGLEKLDRTIGMAAGGKNKDAAALFAKLGISLKDSHGHLLTITEAMPKLAQAFKNTSDPAMRMRMAVTLFSRAGAEMLPMLLEASEGLQKFDELSAKVNYAPTTAETAGLKSFHEGWIGLRMAVQGMTDAIGAKLGPVLAPIIEKFRDWVAANKEWLATEIAKKVEELAKWIKTIDLKAITTSMKAWATSIGDVASHLGGTNVAIGALVLAIGAPLLMGITVAFSAFTALSGVIVSLTAIMLANPFIAAAVAIAAAAVLIYEYWGPISGFFGRLWDGAIEGFRGFGRMMGDIAGPIWKTIEPGITAVGAGIKSVFTGLYDWFSSQPGWVQALLTAINPVLGIPMLIIENWEPIKAFFIMLWDGVKKAFVDAWSYIEPIVAKLRGAVDLIAGHWLAGPLGLAPQGLPHPIRAGDPGERRFDPIAAGMFGGDTFGLLPPMLPSPYAAGSPAAPGAAGASGTVSVKIDMTGVPPGTRTSTSSTGTLPAPDLSVGYGNPAPYGY